jgi:redox-sensitive bicupin YhaK (pirin superfamily)
MSVDLHPAAHRFVTRAEGRKTHHSFSFGPHYDPANLGFGPLVCHNDDHVAPGGGYPDHPHTDLEIVTWVLDGALTHTDSAGERTVVEQGTVQVMSAGSGIRHSELVDPASGPTRFLQVWVRPDEPGTAPWHRTASVANLLATGELVPVVSGRHTDGVARIGTRRATVWAARLAAGSVVRLPDDPLQHVFVARGAVDLDGGFRDRRFTPSSTSVTSGDALRILDEPGHTVVAAEPTELLVWSFTR